MTRLVCGEDGLTREPQRRGVENRGAGGEGKGSRPIWLGRPEIEAGVPVSQVGRCMGTDSEGK